MKKTAILLSAVMAFGSFAANIPSACAEAVTEEIFFTDFDSYSIKGEKTEQAFEGDLSTAYGIMKQSSNEKGNKITPATNIGGNAGTCLQFDSNEEWQNITVPVGETLKGRYLISFDYYIKDEVWGITKILTNDDGSTVAKIYGGNLLFEGGEKQLALATNVWHNIAVYTDTAARKYVLYADGYKVDEKIIDGTGEYPLSSVQIQMVNPSTKNRYLDNFCVRKVDICPEQTVFSTDFDSYRIGQGAKTQSVFESLSSIYGRYPAYVNGKGGNPTGAAFDTAYGTSMKLPSGDWSGSFEVILPKTQAKPMLISFDLNMAGQGTLNMVGDNGNTFLAQFAGPNLNLNNVSGTYQTTIENALKVGKWEHIDIYADNENKTAQLYLNGEKTGDAYGFRSASYSQFSVFQLQHQSGGDMYVDNLSIRYADENYDTDSKLIYKTDFDSWQVGGRYVSEKISSLESAYGIMDAASNGSEIQCGTVDLSHGTSLVFKDGDWRSAQIKLPKAQSGTVAVSFDIYMKSISTGTLRVIGNNANNFTARIAGRTLSSNPNVSGEYQDVIALDKWEHIDIYADNENDEFYMYVNGKLVGNVNDFAGGKTDLQSIQFQKISGGDIYIDNVTVKTAEAPVITKLKMTKGTENVTAAFDALESGAKAFVASYSADGTLLDVSVSEDGAQSVSLPVDSNADIYKAYMWNSKFEPLCGACAKK